MKTAFVILHYLNEEVTERCVRCLRALDDMDRHEIVIVDNASPNGSGKKLQDEYAAFPNIHVLLQEENLGFARGNNVGYRYAKALGARNMVVMNSDVYIYDKAFIRHMQESFEATGADILGPEIYAPFYKLYQNPYSMEVMTPDSTLKWYEDLVAYEKKINRPVIGSFTILYNHMIERLYDYRKRFLPRNPERRYHIVPHGSCVIYGSKWVENEDIAFVPNTFFYGEEHILGYYSQQKQYTCCYVPELYVEHEAGATRKFAFAKVTKQSRFFYKQQIAAVEALMKMMESSV